MTRFKVVCVGAGYFSKYHVEAWKRIPEVELVAICDLDITKAQSLADQFDVKQVFSSTAELYDNLSFDILDIITPPATHLGLCMEATAKGKHIICQKPLSPSFEEAQELISAMNTAKTRFMIHENFRFQPWYRKIKELLDDQAIGDKIFSINHRMRMGDGWSENAYAERQPYFRSMPRLLIHETGIHFVDVFRFLLGDIKSVYSRLRKLNQHIAGEDCGLILFDFENGCQGVFDGNRYNESNTKNPRYTFGEMLIEGNGGSIRLALDGSIYLQKLGQDEVKIDYNHEDKNFSSDCVYAAQKHFVDCLISGNDFETNANDYLKNLQVQEAIYLSAEKRKEIDL